MNKPETILTDAEMQILISYSPFTLGLSIARLKDFIRQAEKAVVAKLVAEQEPVAKVSKETFSSDGTSDIITNNLPIGTPLYAHPMPVDKQEPIWWEINDRATGKREVTDCNEDAEFYKEKGGYDVTPLYAHPFAPPMNNKTFCVSENAESDTQTGGQGILDSSSQEKIQIISLLKSLRLEFGAVGTRDIDVMEKNKRIDAAIEAIENHIPDIGQMVTPLAQRKIQTLLDKGEYRVIENATVLVNENGHAAIVNHGGAFYWVDNEALVREFNGAEAETEEKRK